MRAVNLLPEEYRARRPTGARSGSAYAVVGILAAVLVAAAVYILADNQVKDRQAKLTRVQNEAAVAEAEANSLTAFTNFRSVAQGRIETVRGLAQARFDWERTLRELAHVLPDTAWVTTLNATGVSGSAEAAQAASAGGGGAGPTLQMSGCARGYIDVATVLVRLRKLSGAADATLAQSTKESDEGGACGTSNGRGNNTWDATVSFVSTQRPPAAEGREEVPAALGGGE